MDRRKVKINGTNEGPMVLIPKAELEAIGEFQGKLISILHHIAQFKGNGELRLPLDELMKFDLTKHGVDILQSGELKHLVVVKCTGPKI